MRLRSDHKKDRIQHCHLSRRFGFTLLELLSVIVVIAVIAIIIAPRFLSAQSDARAASMRNLAANTKAIVEQVKLRARAKGLSPVGSNPGGGSAQSVFIVETDFGSFEVDWRNLCPESRAELGDRLNTLDFFESLGGGTEDFETRVTNRTTWIGYDIPPGTCYMEYDSFACTVTTEVAGC